MSNTANYIERDLSWMYFNQRILAEAKRADLPLLERINMLGIYSNNLDEYFKVRVAALSDKSDKDLLDTIGKMNAEMSVDFRNTIHSLNDCLRNEGIFMVRDYDITEGQKCDFLTPKQQENFRNFIKDYCLKNLAGILSPIWLSKMKDVSTLPDEGIYLLVALGSDAMEEAQCAVVEIPVKKLGRFVVLPEKREKDKVTNYIMYLDDVVRCGVPYMFVGLNFTSFDTYSFKFTKNAQMVVLQDLDEGTLEKIEKSIKKRKKGSPVRIIFDEQMPKPILKQLLKSLDCRHQAETIQPSGRYQNHKDYMKFPDLGRKDLKNPAWPTAPSKYENISMFDTIYAGDQMIHVPYQSFDIYIQLLREAAINPHVRSIKTTLYRLAKDSKVIGSLISAARNGKQVTVVMELMARFDEESNIHWATLMTEAGIRVTAGVEGLKVHSKITHIECDKGNIAVVSTGNFHEGNAKCYTDLLMFTSRKAVVDDVANVFEFIDKPFKHVKFNELLVSPNHLRKPVLDLIDKEIENHQLGLPSGIKVKINHITDKEIVEKLYEAANKGVKVDLLVRGNCSLVSGQERLHNNLTVRGIIDRYLEHSRILVFTSRGDFKVYIGSSDWMTRNLDRRVEVYAPVLDPALKEQAKMVVEYGLADTVHAYIVDGNKNNALAKGDKKFRSQEELWKYYQN